MSDSAKARLTILVACTLLPLAVLKHNNLRLEAIRKHVACTLLPLAVLKLVDVCPEVTFGGCMHPITVYGIETGQCTDGVDF